MRLLFASVCLLTSAIAEGITVSFNDANRGPSNILHIGGVTLSSAQTAGGQPATFSGQGLGVSGPVGMAYSFDQELYYSEGQFTPQTTLRENPVTFSLNPAFRFVSITIVPYLSISGSMDPPDSSFSIEYDVTGSMGPWVGDYFLSPGPDDYGQPMTFYLDNGPSGSVKDFFRFDLFLSTGLAGDHAVNFFEHRQAHINEAETFQFGFVMRSLDYEAVPEPSAVLLACCGTGLWWTKRKTIVKSLHRFAFP